MSSGRGLAEGAPIPEPITDKGPKTSFGTLILSIIYFLALGCTELIILYASSSVGMFIYLAILLGLIITAFLDKVQEQRGLWLALGMVPLIRYMTLSLPVMIEISRLIWYIVISIPILVGIITVSRSLNYSPSNIGLNFKKPAMQILIIFVGIGLGAVDYFILKPNAWNTSLTMESTLLPALTLLIFTGVVEELAFRGVMQRAANALASYGWIYIAAIYSLIQIGQGSALHCLFVFVVGLLFGWTVKSTGSIIGVGISHGLINIGLFLVFPHILPLS